MSYFEYVIGAYAVFAFYLAWDYLAPRIELQRTRRMIVQRAARETARRKDAAE
ncbi:MAG TPA: heme exporter protein CcmD [Arenimonas sp.]|nr:heme exporter protein CcmD [Arenimonas sp.]